ncbi:uncharacterized protein LOC126887687 [Diabrotica virgifera virgifera]|uniref:CHK kinase-like domain-containing protein n=1 Tax=Diabrotica virgifera virgifera TaxID=50390 RepID=A0ABM5KM69_DIAVI|nr:uncharacterized protein LOC126887687 [Diabrotica virgifera virgifera]
MTIKNIEKLLEKYIDDGKNIIGSEITNLVEPGENYGGELFKIDVTIQEISTKKKDVLHLVGKIIPQSEGAQAAFNVQMTFKSEIAFYEKIVPELQGFQKKHNIQEVISCFPKYYGSRLNLNGSDKVDRDGVILLENLKVKGYHNLDRYIGYNLEDTKLLLRDLAIFQSTVVALKIKEPDVFNRKVKPFCNNYMVRSGSNPFKKMVLVIEEILAESEECKPFIPKVKRAWDKGDSKTEVREPFATICHRDLWLNNTMTKYESGKPPKNMFFDFQLYDYGSPAVDVLNFIFTSVQTAVAKQYFDDLIHHYHAEFVSNLERFGCDTEPFSYTNFLKELEMESEIVLGWTMDFVSLVVFSKKGQSLGDLNPDFEDPKFRQMMKDRMMPEAKERLLCIINQCHKYNWL